MEKCSRHSNQEIPLIEGEKKTLLQDTVKMVTRVLVLGFIIYSRSAEHSNSVNREEVRWGDFSRVQVQHYSDLIEFMNSLSHPSPFADSSTPHGDSPPQGDGGSPVHPSGDNSSSDAVLKREEELQEGEKEEEFSGY